MEPRTVEPERKSTLATVAPPVALAVAFSVNGAPSPIFAPKEGSVSATLGGKADTVTFTVEDETVVPAESNACAVRATVPVVDGVQDTMYGEVVSGEPVMATPLA